jgi:hypothetical protein
MSANDQSVISGKSFAVLHIGPIQKFAAEMALGHDLPSYFQIEKRIRVAPQNFLLFG